MGRLTERMDSEKGFIMFLAMITPLMKFSMPFIKDVCTGRGQTLMYSGRSSDVKFFSGKIRANRKPKDTHITIHNDINDEFKRQFGYPARSNSMFVTGDSDDATEYGTPYMIFPIGNYKILWNSEVGDLYIHLKRIMSGWGMSLVHQYRENPLLASFVERQYKAHKAGRYANDDSFEEYYDDTHDEDSGNGYYVYEYDGDTIRVPDKYNNFKSAKKYIKDNHDLDVSVFDMVWHANKSYVKFYADEYEKWNNDKIAKAESEAKDEYYEYISELVKGYESGNVRAALLSGNEIMLTSSTYYAINYDYYSLIWLFLEWAQKKRFKYTNEELKDWWDIKGQYRV